MYSSHQAPLSMGFSRQDSWSGLPFPSPGHLPDPGIEPSWWEGGLKQSSTLCLIYYVEMKSYLLRLSISFLLCKIRMMVVSPFGFYCEHQMMSCVQNIDHSAWHKCSMSCFHFCWHYCHFIQEVWRLWLSQVEEIMHRNDKWNDSRERDEGKESPTGWMRTMTF